MYVKILTFLKEAIDSEGTGRTSSLALFIRLLQKSLDRAPCTKEFNKLDAVVISENLIFLRDNIFSMSVSPPFLPENTRVFDRSKK